MKAEGIKNSKALRDVFVGISDKTSLKYQTNKKVTLKEKIYKVFNILNT